MKERGESWTKSLEGREEESKEDGRKNEEVLVIAIYLVRLALMIIFIND